MDKVIDKAVFDVIVQLVRDYWNSNPCEERTRKRLEVVRKFLKNHFPEYERLYDFLNDVFRFVRDGVEDNQIYGALKCLGWRVEDEAQVS